MSVENLKWLEQYWTSEKREVNSWDIIEVIRNIDNSKRLVQEHYLKEKWEINNFKDSYNKILNSWSWPDWFDNISNHQESKKLLPSKPIQNNPEIRTVKQNNNLSEKEKIWQYAILANLAYARFEKVNNDWTVDINNLKVKEASLDIAWIDFTKFNIDSSWKVTAHNSNKLSPDEKFILKYLGSIDNSYDDTKNRGTNDRNVSDIIDMALFRNKQRTQELANQKDNYPKIADSRNILTDIDKWYNISRLPSNDIIEEESRLYRSTLFIETNKPKLTEALIRLKESKSSEYQKQFEDFKEKGQFKILAYYPEEWAKDDGWFQCTLFEKDWKKILAIAWTQITDCWDIGSDLSILIGKVPETQTKRMIDFFKKHVSWNEKITIIGHSLWGALSQIGTAIYGNSWKIEETYTFNSPWAKNLTINTNNDDPYINYLQNFTKYKEYGNIWELVTNVKWSEGVSPIAWKWVDIGKYRVEVETISHSILAVIEAIEKADVLVRKKVDWTVIERKNEQE